MINKCDFLINYELNATDYSFSDSSIGLMNNILNIKHPYRIQYPEMCN